MSNAVTPFSLRDTPALIERLLPVQKLSAEAYKELKAAKVTTGRWHTGTNLVDRLLGKEL